MNTNNRIYSLKFLILITVVNEKPYADISCVIILNPNAIQKKGYNRDHSPDPIRPGRSRNKVLTYENSAEGRHGG